MKLEIVTRWIWGPGALTARIVEVRGGQMPSQVRATLQGTGPESIQDEELIRKAELVGHGLAGCLPAPTPLDIGGTEKIAGHITSIGLVDCRTSETSDSNYISVAVEYENGIATDQNGTFKLHELPELVQKLILHIHRRTNQYVKTWFWEQFGQGNIAPEKWKGTKTEVFISYRSTDDAIATQLFNALGTYENSSVFIPRMDAVDLQAGNWMNQLMEMIARTPIFLPILTADYLDGPFCRPELDLALRELFKKSNNKRVIPVLVQGKSEDYASHFIGGFHMVKATAGLSQEKICEIAYLALGISRNPYE